MTGHDDEACHAALPALRDFFIFSSDFNSVDGFATLQERCCDPTSEPSSADALALLFSRTWSALQEECRRSSANLSGLGLEPLPVELAELFQLISSKGTFRAQERAKLVFGLALQTIVQVGRYVLHLLGARAALRPRQPGPAHQMPAIPSPYFAGVGSGFLASVVAASSTADLGHDFVGEIVDNAVHAVRLAFRVGRASAARESREGSDSVGRAFAFLSMESADAAQVKALCDEFTKSDATSPLAILVSQSSLKVLVVHGTRLDLQRLQAQLQSRGYRAQMDAYPMPFYSSPISQEYVCSAMLDEERNASPASANVRFQLKYPVASLVSGRHLAPGTALDASAVLAFGLGSELSALTWDEGLLELAKLEENPLRSLMIGHGANNKGKYDALLEHVLDTVKSVHPHAEHFPAPAILSLNSHVAEGVCSPDFASILRPTPAESVAIVGISCRLPEANSPNEFWDMLMKGVDACREVPGHLYDINMYYDPQGAARNRMGARHGNWFDGIVPLFDPEFFGISDEQALHMDPQQRMAMLVAFEALEQAGFAPEIADSAWDRESTGVFVAATCDDYRENLMSNITQHYLEGNYRQFLAQRLSRHFGFSGPAHTLDTACNASFVALDAACTQLVRRKCSAALVGGVSVLTQPQVSVGLDKAYFLSRTGQCKTFDEGADGYSRSDAVSFIVIKRLEDAIAHNDNILGTIIGIGTNHRRVLVTEPSTFGIRHALMTSVLRSANVQPWQVGVVEAHGTGTQAGDWNELTAIRGTFVEPGRDQDNMIAVTSSKANIGHSEGASGLGALIKLLLMVKHNTVPPHIGIRTRLNPRLEHLLKDRIALATNGPIELPRPKGQVECYACVNNFGAAGGNTSLILREHIAEPRTTSSSTVTRHLVIVSGQTTTALERNVRNVIDYVKAEGDRLSLPDLSYTTVARRAHFKYRKACLVSSAADLCEALETAAVVERTKNNSQSQVGLVFPSFTASAATVLDAGRALFRAFPTFRHYVQVCDSVLQGLWQPGVLDAFGEGKASADEVVVGFVIQYALFATLEDWGVPIHTVAGAGHGQLLAIVASKASTLEDALAILIAARDADSTALEQAVSRINPSASKRELMSSSWFSVHGTLSAAAIAETFNKDRQRTVPEDIKLPADVTWWSMGGQGLAHVIPGTTSLLNEGDTTASVLEALRTALLATLPVRWNAVQAELNPGARLSPLASYAWDYRSFFVPYADRALVLPSWSDNPKRAQVGKPSRVKARRAPKARKLQSRKTGIRKAARVSPVLGLVSTRGRSLVFDLDLKTEVVEQNFTASFRAKRYLMAAELFTAMAVEALQFRHASDEHRPGVDVHGLEVLQPVALDKASGSLRLELAPLRDGWHECTFSEVSGDEAFVCGHCSVRTASSSDFKEGWEPLVALVKGQLANLRNGAGNGSKMGATLLYRFLSKVVTYPAPARMLKSMSFSVNRKSALASLQASAQDQSWQLKQGTAVVPASAILGVVQALTVLANPTASSRDDALYQPTSMSMQVSEALSVAMSKDRKVEIVAAMFEHRSEGGVETVSSAYFVDAQDGTIYGALRDVLFKPIQNQAGPSRTTKALLPRVTPAAKVSSPKTPLAADKVSSGLVLTQTQSSAKAASPPPVLDAEPVKASPSVDKLLATMQDIIATETGVGIEELSSGSFADFGVDSLMSLAILGRMREIAPFELPGSLFIDCETWQDLEDYLKEQLPSSSVEATTVSSSPSASPAMSSSAETLSTAATSAGNDVVPSQSSSPSAASVAECMGTIAEVISSETGVDQADLAGSAFADMGIDSLMSLALLGRLRELLPFELPGSLFIDCETMDDLEEFVVEQVADQPPSAAITTPEAESKPAPSASATHPSAIEVERVLESPGRALLLGGSKDSTHTQPLFLLPDGSGTSAVYQHLPKMDRIVYGLNSPFLLKNAGPWTKGVPEIAAHYIAQIRARQPHGPYLLGGWSFGGVVSYEIVRQLACDSEVVKGLILLDAPCPRNMPPLPHTIIDWATESGALNGLGIKKFSPEMISHFRAAIQTLSDYDPPSLSPDMAAKTKVVLITAVEGVGADPNEVVNTNETVSWLMHSRAGLGANGWERLLGRGNVRVEEIGGNHFTMMNQPYIGEWSSAIRRIMDDWCI